jgi:hypothetical protein
VTYPGAVTLVAVTFAMTASPGVPSTVTSMVAPAVGVAVLRVSWCQNSALADLR